MVQESTNTFSDGLITDLNPLTTPNSVLTDALNATLLTFNGNELVLQNDMGNTKVSEEAKLTEGFTPIGIKEHGGLIYIVSHNSETKETEIGTFPSPLDLPENPSLLIKIDDLFLDENGTSLNQNRNLSKDITLSSGDGFIIFLKTSIGENFYDLFSSYDNTIRKFYKLKLISIDNGAEFDITDSLSFQYKIVDGVEVKTKYWVVPLGNDETEISESLMERYSHLVQRYKPRKGGKLYLRIELENIDDFYINSPANSRYPDFLVDGDDYFLKFNMFIKALSNLKPDTITLKLNYLNLTNNTENNETFIIPVSEFLDFTNVLQIINLNKDYNKILTYTITPSNENYGIIFEDFVISNTIDLSADPLSWMDSANADYEYEDYFHSDYKTY